MVLIEVSRSMLRAMCHAWSRGLTGTRIVGEEEGSDGRGGARRSSVVFISVLCRPGDDLLSHVLRQSTIGAKAFDGRVRDGIGSDRLARATRPAKNGYGRRMAEVGGRTFLPSSDVRFSGVRSKQNWVFGDGGRRSDNRTVIRPLSSGVCPPNRALATRAIKSNERLVPVSCTRCRAFTSGLSTWWSSTALQGELVLRLVSRLDAFSGYPFRI
jgi:hypothetical protein